MGICCRMRANTAIAIRSLGVIGAALVCAMAFAQATAPDPKSGGIAGTVYTIDADGTRSIVPGAQVKLVGPSVSQETVTDEQGKYSFVTPPNTYEIDVTAPGLCGSNSVTLTSNAALDVPVEMRVVTVKESVTVSGSAEPPLSTDSSPQTVISRSTAL